MAKNRNSFLDKITAKFAQEIIDERVDYKEAINMLQIALVKQAIKRYGRNNTKIAIKLGLSRTTVTRIVQRMYGEYYDDKID